MELSEEMLDILACPKCKGSLQSAGESLVCEACRLRYPIRQGIPVLLVEEAEKLSEE
ncbi:MAG: Trm112 family protein [Geobacter sp.]|nr:MAG: Trm112 family protein [Geobacter sp.]